jgi:1-acyl-sn-glycerol-3-phosphate acyltransferase
VSLLVPKELRAPYPTLPLRGRAVAYASPIKRSIGKLVVRLFRYRQVGDAPDVPVCVMVAAPHTSNWDFILMIAMAWSNGLDVVWLGKKEMFAGPASWLFRAMGGIPVDRKSPAGLVDAVVELAGSGRHVAIVIPPEGTRAKRTYWKSGFRRIARAADVPVSLSFLDGPTRTGGFGPLLTMTDDVVADMDQVRAFYADKLGVRPGYFTPPLLREEVAGSDTDPDADPELPVVNS